MTLNKEIESNIIDHSLRDKPRECCGFIIDKLGKLFTHECPNNSREPEKFFSISPIDYLNAVALGKIISVYHSHVEEGGFSEGDKLNSISHNLPFVMYCIKTNSFSFFNPKDTTHE